MIASTLTLHEASRCCWDVAVVGAGPAGALAARELARRGISVLLVDRAAFPRWKVCGSCVNGRALNVLDRAGLADLPGRMGAVPLRQLWLASHGRRARVPLLPGVAISREALDAALVEAAIQGGSAFLPETNADLLAAGAEPVEHRRLILRNKDGAAEVTARLVLAADGLGGRLVADDPPTMSADSWIGAGAVLNGAPRFYEPGTVYMACGRSGYVGLVRLEDGRLDVAAALDPGAVRQLGRPGLVAQQVMEEAGLPDLDAPTDALWRGTPLLTRRAPRLADTRVFVLGDAAGYVEPFTGEGIAWALAAAWAVVPLAMRAVEHWSPALAHAWSETYRRVVGQRQGACRVVARGLRHPLVIAATVEILARLPTLARPLLRQLNRAGPMRREMWP